MSPQTPASVRNPANVTEVVGFVPILTAGEVHRVLERAHEAFRSWGRTNPQDRSDRLRASARALREASEHLARLFVKENGKPLQEARRDIQRSIEVMERIADLATDWFEPSIIDSEQPVWIRKRPRGLTAVISPWNSPVLLSFKRFVPAVAAGNTVVVKPATNCPLTVMECIRIVGEHFPPDVLNVVTGSGSIVGEVLASDERVRTVAFTGSTKTGRRVMELAAPSVKQLFLELGGNDPAIVLSDASLDEQAIQRMTSAILRSAGQVCIAIKRIYVHHSRFRELVDKLTDSFDRVVVGDGLLPETTMGPLNNKAQFDFVSGLLETCRGEGLEVVTKGGKLSPHTWQHGYFLLPSIVLGAAQHAQIVHCEQFGPIIPIVPFSDEDEALTWANDTDYGLRASVWTSNRGKASEFADLLQAGAVFHNNHGIFRDVLIEFPGVKQSGLGHHSRLGGLDYYSDSFGFAD